MNSQEVSVTIRGREYRLKSFKNAEYARKLARYVDEVMKTIETGTGSRDHLNIMILSLLQITHSYFEAQETKDAPNIKIESEIAKIIKSIEKTEKELGKMAAAEK